MCYNPVCADVSGALMLIAWMTTGTLGMLVARYLKGVAKGQGCWNKDVWFLVRVLLYHFKVTPHRTDSATIPFGKRLLPMSCRQGAVGILF